MTISQTRQGLGGLIYLALSFTLGAYFTFAAVQGDYGVFRRVEITAEAEALAAERDKLALELAEMSNLSRRLSDGYLVQKVEVQVIVRQPMRQVLHLGQLGRQLVTFCTQPLGLGIDRDAGEHPVVALHRRKGEVDAQSAGESQIDQPTKSTL